MGIWKWWKNFGAEMTREAARVVIDCALRIIVPWAISIILGIPII
jgi:hypothetical protein